jgi:hypothetical protein
MKWRTELRPCPICGSSQTRLLGARGGRAHHAGNGVLTSVVRCRECHGVYQQPTPVPEFNPYEDHAPAEYFQFNEAQRKTASGEALATSAEPCLRRTRTSGNIPQSLIRRPLLPAVPTIPTKLHHGGHDVYSTDPGPSRLHRIAPVRSPPRARRAPWRSWTISRPAASRPSATSRAIGTLPTRLTA